MIEALWMFLAYTSMYFFWKSYNKEGDIKYALISGVFLGLADDTKYNAFFLYISFILFILWTKKSGWCLGWKHLLEKKYLLLFFVSILVFSPVLIDLYVHDANPFLWQLASRQINVAKGYSVVGCSGILDILRYGFNSYVDMMIDRDSIATLSLSWLPLFWLSALFLLLITLLYYLYALLKAQPSGSFLMAVYIVLNVPIVLFLQRHQYYVLWAIPILFIMISNISVSFFEELKFRYAKRGLRFFTDSTKILVLISICIFSFSYIVVGTMAPSLNEGEQAGYEKQVLNIKNKIQPGECVAIDLHNIVIHYFKKYDSNAKEHNISLLPLYKREKRIHYPSTEVNVELLDRAKPRFIITSDYSFSAYATVRANKEIRQHYDLISNEDGVCYFMNGKKSIKVFF
jgi:4-amino-4-deoxy-L-arabinose transferase-like glycosyltransferase